MRVSVRTRWGAGIVSVANKYVKKAIDLGQSLEIEHEGQVMTIPLEKLKEKKPRTGRFGDKFGRKQDYLLYDFFWEL